MDISTPALRSLSAANTKTGGVQSLESQILLLRMQIEQVERSHSPEDAKSARIDTLENRVDNLSLRLEIARDRNETIPSGSDASGSALFNPVYSQKGEVSPKGSPEAGFLFYA